MLIPNHAKQDCKESQYKLRTNRKRWWVFLELKWAAVGTASSSPGMQTGPVGTYLSPRSSQWPCQQMCGSRLGRVHRPLQSLSGWCPAIERNEEYIKPHPHCVYRKHHGHLRGGFWLILMRLAESKTVKIHPARS